MGLNKAILMGRLTKDVELRYTQSNKPVCSFTLAVDRTFKRDGEPEADFFRVTAFGKTAEFASKWFTKGQQVVVVGHIQIGEWTDKNGNKRTSVDLIAEEVHFADTKKSEAPKKKSPSIDGFEECEEDEDTPF